MAQYFHIANDTKKQYLNDHAFHELGQAFVGGHGIDFGSIITSRFGSLQLLAILLSSDISFGQRETPSFAGEWQRDSIGMYGDYGSSHEYETVTNEYEDITPRLLAELMALPYWRGYLESTCLPRHR